ncbi:uncharacterized protein YpiB (UPF0302 family) [Bacillus mesophilus]|uniref:IDEAL domain-containing protein n=1 Tax=Bacillus mesophilus TaxID=1808955 RepID=A0A6M0Q2U8_9BACI|nr:IDEAL domain-containing protein [Bacillus mesophilus]MBM7659846.1 uncharacterized protein YpiB (UPF0302 family) [Bacillus mesophilus]NEY70705.1 IDEAL domain-containing protein [Bacillus mesophilus]
MKEKPSYSDIHNGRAKINKQQTDNVNLYVQMLLDEILIKARVKKLIVDIDHALDQRDYSSFQRLSKEYKQLMDG